MAKILLTGIATLDIVNYVADYPNEDDEIRALSQHHRRGGNAANTAAVLSQYTHHCHLACTLANDSSGQFILNDLKQRSIGFNPGMIIAGTTPTSYITIGNNNGSRTIVHYRDLAELSFDQFRAVDLADFDWFHFEARNVEQTELMMQCARRIKKTISLEVEKDRPGLECLFPLADIILHSRPYASAKGFDHPEPFLLHISQSFPDKLLTCSWGDQGAWGIEQGTVIHSPAYPTNKIIDTLGAGDTFNAGIIHALIEQQGLSNALQNACRLAGLKCGQTGFDFLVDR